MARRRTAVVIGEDLENCIVCDHETSLMVTRGLPPPTVIEQAFQCYPNAQTLIADPEHVNALTAILETWECHPVRVYVLDTLRRPSSPIRECRWLQVREILDVENGPDFLRDNLLAASRRSRIAAAFADRQPVSFCFASSLTESLWNVAVETSESHRRQGFGSACVCWMAERWLARGLRPVWGAPESNLASIAMAESLGFVLADRNLVFRRAPD